jgi:hypothetical protein
MTVVALLSPVIALAVVMALQLIEQWALPAERVGAREPAGLRARRSRARLLPSPGTHHDLDKNFVVR